MPIINHTHAAGGHKPVSQKSSEGLAAVDDSANQKQGPEDIQPEATKAKLIDRKLVRASVVQQLGVDAKPALGAVRDKAAIRPESAMQQEASSSRGISLPPKENQEIDDLIADAMQARANAKASAPTPSMLREAESADPPTGTMIIRYDAAGSGTTRVHVEHAELTGTSIQHEQTGTTKLADGTQDSAQAKARPLWMDNQNLAQMSQEDYLKQMEGNYFPPVPEGWTAQDQPANPADKVYLVTLPNANGGVASTEEYEQHLARFPARAEAENGILEFLAKDAVDQYKTSSPAAKHIPAGPPPSDDIGAPPPQYIPSRPPAANQHGAPTAPAGYIASGEMPVVESGPPAPNYIPSRPPPSDDIGPPPPQYAPAGPPPSDDIGPPPPQYAPVAAPPSDDISAPPPSYVPAGPRMLRAQPKSISKKVDSALATPVTPDNLSNLRLYAENANARKSSGLLVKNMTGKAVRADRDELLIILGQAWKTASEDELPILRNAMSRVKNSTPINPISIGDVKQALNVAQRVLQPVADSHRRARLAAREFDNLRSDAAKEVRSKKLTPAMPDEPPPAPPSAGN